MIVQAVCQDAAEEYTPPIRTFLSYKKTIPLFQGGLFYAGSLTF